MNRAPGGIFIGCGEVSGDMYAASLARSLRAAGYDGPLSGMVGERGAAAGIESVRDASELHLMGVGEVLHAIPRLLRLRRELTDFVTKGGFETVVLVDSPDFHLPLLSMLRSRGWRGRAVYAVPPTVWAWRGERVKALVRDVDLCLPLFGFEHDHLVERGVSSAWLGHPLVDDFPANPAPPSGDRIALLPGSRGSEARALLPALRECALMFRAEGLVPVFSIAPGMSEAAKEWMRGELRGFELFEGGARELLGLCAAAAGASGTVAVEAMMLDRFMVVMYRTGILTWLAWKLLGRTKNVSIPNILAGRNVYPELLQWDATGERAFREITSYLKDGSRRDQVHDGLAAARARMGKGGALDFWAREVLLPAGAEGTGR